MFLSKEAITKQLFYEFLNFKILGLSPGKPVEMRPGTLLGSSSKEDLGLAIEFAERQLKSQLNIPDATPGEKELFNTLFSNLIKYKKSSTVGDNPFTEYAHVEANTAHPCAWYVFAPLLMEPNGNTLRYETAAHFIEYLQDPKVVFHFDARTTVDKTGLFIAVNTNNHEMVEAFLCPEFYGYQLNKADLKKLLALTTDMQTRLALFRHSKELINWISEDRQLQSNCVLNYEELAALWAILDSEQRKEFIKNTSSKLWLKLLDKELGKQKIEKLLGADFTLLNTKLLQDISIKNTGYLPKIMLYLSNNQQFSYLLNRVEVNKLYPSPHGLEWNNLLVSLGYHITKDNQLSILRYIVPAPVARAHTQLIKTLLSLPVESQIIIEALEKIETYVHDPMTKEEYQQFLNRIAKETVNKEYETGLFIINWINKLLRYLKIKPESPLHPYIDRLVQSVEQTEMLQIIPGKLMSTLPPVRDYEVYREALAAYFNSKIDVFWFHIPQEEKIKITHDPIRFAALVQFLSTPEDHRTEFFTALDEESLSYFNTTKGLRQLILETPSFNASRDLPVLINAMKNYDMQFLEEIPSIVEILLDSDEEVFKQVHPFFHSQSNNTDDLLFQQSVLEALPKPLQQTHLTRFLTAYCTDAYHFSTLLLMIHNSNPILVNQCWENVPEAMWSQWYGELDHAALWSEVLTHLELSDRLDFFEKLISEGKLTADEFCDFLLQKNEAVFLTLWSKIPEQQWATWLKENSNLPLTTVSLLNTMPYPLRVQFFKSMLKMTATEIASLCVVPNKTVEQLYPQEVAVKVASATTVSDAKAKLAVLKENKQKEFNDNVNQLIKNIEDLNRQLIGIGQTNLKAHMGYIVYTVSFFRTDPYYVFLAAIGACKNAINTLCNKITNSPLLKILKEQSVESKDFAKLATEMQTLHQQLEALQAVSQEMPSDLNKEFQALKLVFNKLELIQPLPLLSESTLAHSDSQIAIVP